MVGRLLSISSEEFSIGRDPGNDLPIPGDRQVSRLHVMLVARMGTVHLVEQGRILPDGSRISPLHGTFVDGKRMTRDVRLYDGNMIGLGQSTIFSIKLDVE
jgi:pSer/pThr/pTyr-binding forkhead associated (FHA) protein